MSILDKKDEKVSYLTRAAVIAALYVVLTLVFAPISFGESGIDIRIAEMLNVLPFFLGEAVPGLFVGCLLANILGGGIIWDIIFGSLATLVGAVLARKLSFNRFLVPLPAVAANMLVVPVILWFGYGVQAVPFPLLMLSVGGGEFLSAYVLGEVLLSLLIPYREAIFKEP